MPYYGDGLPYYYGAPFANHSSLMTGTARTLHTPYSRFSPHLSTITESPLSNLRRYNPVTVSPRPKRVIDTADIDVSTPRILSRETNNHQRNRLRRDRPTIKIRSQALKDNPALREHNERHEKSVGELLVEKFLIKDKKQKLETDTERRLRVFHQVSLDRSDDLVVKSKITRRFTRRRSSADIQLDPAQLEREVAYAQVQAEVLDTLVAEEQAEIENEVRRGTLIRKSTIGGPRTVPSFFRNLDRDSHDEEDEAAAHRNRKNLKKVKKRKKTTEKPSPPDEEGSTSSDVSVDYEAELEDPKPQMYKIEASNSAGDFSTVWLNAPEPRNPEATAPEENDLETVVLAVKKPYVKDTSRNSVYFTVKSPESVKPPENGVDVAASPGKELGKQTKKKSILKKKLSEKVPCDEEVAEKPEVDGLKAAPTTQGAEEASVVSTVDGGENSGSASVARLPKESKINTDENNAVEAPELSLGEAKYLAKPTKNERDEDIPLPGKNKAPTLAKKPPAGTVGGGCEQEEKLKEETGATGSEKIAIERTTLIEGKTEGRDFDEEKGETKKVGGALRAKETGRTKSEGTGGEEPKFERNDVEKSRGGISKFAKVESKGSPTTEVDKTSKVQWKKGVKELVVAKKEAGDVSSKKEVEEKAKDSLPGSPKIEVNVESKFPWRKGPQKEPVAPKPAETKIVNDLKEVSEVGKSKECSPSSPKTEVNAESKFPWRKGPAKEPVAPKPAETKIVNDSNKVPEVEKSKECSPTSPKTEVNSASKIPWKKALPKLGKEQTAKNSDKTPTENSPKLEKTNLPSSHQPSTEGTTVGKLKFPNKTQPRPAENIVEPVKDDTGSLSKSTSTESIDFWSEIKAPDSPQVTKPKTPATSPFSKIPEDPVNLQTALEPPKASVERSATGEPMKQPDSNKKETDLKISVGPPAVGVGNPVLESEADLESSKPKTEEETVPEVKKEARRNKNNLSITIDPYSTIKKTPLKREDSTPTNSVQNTPETAIPAEAPTPVPEDSLPTINIVPAFARSDSQVDDDEDPTTPTNEWADVPARISKWSNQGDLSNVDAEKDVTPVASKSASVLCSPEDSPESSKKKKVVKKKKGSKSSTMKSSATKSSTTKSGKTKKSSVVEKEGSQGSLKPPERKSSPRTSPRNSPTQRPIDLIRMFYTTPTALLTATPRDLSKVRRAKIKRRKHQSRTPSVSSDSTGSTTSTATGSTGSGSTCTELDDDPEHKRMNSTRSNDSGFDGSPRISTPSQSSDAQRNSDSSDHFPSGRITPPATNLPRFKKYAVTDFNFLKVLGKGSFGKVLLAELRGTECVYAVKCLKKDVVLEDDDVECTLIERKVLTLATRHPYLCHLFCTFQTDSHLFFVMEYLNGGDLMFHIQKSGRFPEPRARFYAAEIWSGLNFLHKKGIVYRDLKLDNVLLDYEGHIRIADFGMCKLQIFLDRTADTFCGTPDYMAPEIIKGLKYNQAVDWWSYGVLLYEMLTGQSPFSGCDEDELFWSICNERPFIPRYLSQEATDILVCLLEKDSGKRLPGHDIAYHAFFQQLPWDRLERRQMEAPFKPAVDHTLDTRYFDTAFTAERPRLTPVPDQILTSMDQGVFRGFSYTNPNATD